MLLVQGSPLRATAIGKGSFLEGNEGRKGVRVKTTSLGLETKGGGHADCGVAGSSVL